MELYGINIKCYIPLATGQHIPKDVYESLSKQTVRIDIVPCCMLGVVKSQHGECRNVVEKVKGERVSRNLALNLIRESNDDFAIMQDRDIVQIYPDNYERGIDYLKNNQEIAVIALPWKDESDKHHKKISSLIIKVEAIKEFNFNDDGKNHTCETMMNYFKEKYQWFPSEHKLIIEII